MATDTAVTASRPRTARDKAPRGLACGYFVSPCGSRTACDQAGPCSAPVIHFSTAPFVHSCGEADQHVYLNHPQAYPQDVSLTRPRAGVIGASSHAGPGYPRAHSGQRRPGPDHTLIMPRTHSSTIRAVCAFRSMPEPQSSRSRSGAARERDLPCRQSDDPGGFGDLLELLPCVPAVQRRSVHLSAARMAQP